MKIKYRKGYKYQLAETVVFQIPVYPQKDIVTQFIELTTKGKLTIISGYAWDGPSGPTIDTKSSMAGSLIHDVIYQLIRMGLLPLSVRLIADKIALKVWVDSKMWVWRAKLWFRELRKFAGFAADPKNKKKVYEAYAGESQIIVLDEGDE